ncbi:MAG: DNA topoisomerase, partial [Gammaproteobacteria bacterium]|nr:DNA topoisomerase [Gammaproteobacteria bacterium]
NKSNDTSSSSSSSSESSLPALNEGDKLFCTRGELLEKQTQPPKYFTDATLLAAMTGISRYVKDPNVRKVLRETDGLGTEATRANIIELLFTRGYLKRDKKLIRSTPAGRGLIKSLPEVATRPDMTAEWESVLNAICSRESSYDVFMEPLTASIKSLIEQSKTTLPTALTGVKSTNKAAFRKKYRKKS